MLCIISMKLLMMYRNSFGLFRLIQTYLDFVCVCGAEDILDLLDRIILVYSPSAQLLSYNTTFQLGDFTSPNYFTATLSLSPVVAALVLIHERKFQSAHDTHFQIAASRMPSLNREQASFPLVTDEEQRIMNAIRKYLPKATRLRCWNHVFRSVRYWCHSHNIQKDVIQSFIKHLK